LIVTGVQTCALPISIDILRTAQDRAARAEAAMRSLGESLDIAAPPPGSGAIREILDTAAAALDNAALWDAPVAEAAVRSSLGDAYLALGARESGERQLRLAVGLRAKVMGENHPDVARDRQRLLILSGLHAR